MKTLCLYYTRTNTTKAAMEQLAQYLDADIAAYTDGKDRSGLFGYISCCFASADKLASRMQIGEDVDLSSYERVIIGMPVWAEGPCAVGRAFLIRFKEQLPSDVAFLITHSGKNDYEQKILNLDSLLKTPHTAHLSLRTKENETADQQIRAFADRLKA